MEFHPDIEKVPQPFHKIKAGHYATADGKYEIIRDVTGYVSQSERDGDGVLAGCDDDGWALVCEGVNIDWFDTKRDAIAYYMHYIANPMSP